MISTFERRGTFKQDLFLQEVDRQSPAKVIWSCCRPAGGAVSMAGVLFSRKDCCLATWKEFSSFFFVLVFFYVLNFNTTTNIFSPKMREMDLILAFAQTDIERWALSMSSAWTFSSKSGCIVCLPLILMPLFIFMQLIQAWRCPVIVFPGHLKSYYSLKLH